MAATDESAQLVRLSEQALPSALASSLGLVWRGLSLSASPYGEVASVTKPREPAALLKLEQKMRSLHINSERAVIDVYVRGPHLLGDLIGLTRSRRASRKRARHHVKLMHASLPKPPPETIPLLMIDAETSLSPKLAEVHGLLLGALPFAVREVGEQVWVRSPLLTSSDRGRPWVYESPAERAKKAAERKQSKGGSSPLPRTVDPGAAETGFGKQAQQLASATSVVEIGSRTVDGQSATEFVARLDPVRFLGKRTSSKRSKRERQKLRRARVTLDIFIAPNGLPVRTRYDIEEGNVAVVIVADILATEIRVSVQPPLASETITKAELEKLQEEEASSGFTPHLSKREREEERRFEACMNRHLRRHAKHLSKRKFREVLRQCSRRAKIHPARPKPKSKQ